VGVSAAIAVRAERQTGGPYRSLLDFCTRLEGSAVNSRAIESLIKGGALDGLGHSRAHGIKHLPAILHQAQRDRARDSSNQKSLFTDELAPVTLREAEEPEWPLPHKLAEEKEVLGFYLTGHPLAEHVPLLQSLSSASTMGLSGLADSAEVILGGEIVGIRHLMTKKKEPMLRFTLEDLEGSCEVLVWPDLLGRHQGLLTKGQTVFIMGRVDAAGDSNRLVAKDCIELSLGLEHWCKRLILELPRNFAVFQLEALQGMLGRHPGSTAVWMHLHTGHHGMVKQKLPGHLGVTLDEAWLAELAAAIGGGKIFLVNRLNQMARYQPLGGAKPAPTYSEV
jgi:DNA polymerase-3 subunit alpha